ncbi:MAG: hypothetical protein WB561_11260 [Terracidiphilus sp.]
MNRSVSVCILSLCLGLQIGCGSGGGSNSNDTQNPSPTLSSISPNSTNAGSAALTLTATGSGFISSSVVDWNGAALATTFVSGTALTAQLSASDVASAGTANVTVQTPAPGGGTSAALKFTISVPPNPIPTISSLSPSSATEGGPAFTLTVTGTQFISTSQVLWNSSAVTTTYVSGTSLTAQIPASDVASAGTANVTVQTPAPGGGTSAAVVFAINAPPNPVPTISSLSPSSATEGGSAFTLTVTGTQFISTSQVLWNSSAVTTTYASGTSLTAQIPASDLTSAGTANVTVQNPAPDGGTSGVLQFTISPPVTTLSILDLVGTDLVWNPSQQKIYVAVPSTASSNPSTVTVVDPIAASIGSSQSLSSAPSGLAISDDSQFLYAVINGGATIQRLTLPTLATDIQWTLGNDPIFHTQNLAGDIKVQPGFPHTLAVSMGQYGSGSVAVYDDAVQRLTVGGGGAISTGNSLQWKPDGSTLYAAYTVGNDSPGFTTVSDDALYVMPVTAGGVGIVTTYDSTFREEGAHLHSDPATGYIYGDWGEVINGANGIPVGNYRLSRPASTVFPGALSVVDPALQRFYMLQEVREPNNSFAFQIQVFDQTQFKLLSTIVIPNPVGQPTNFIRWGISGLALVTDSYASAPTGKVYLLDGAFVNPSGVEDSTAGTQIIPVPTVTAISPVTAPVGTSGLTLTVTGRDFIPQSTVYWNGTSLQTTMVSSTELSAQVPSSDLASVGLSSITVSNDGNTFASFDSMPFAVNPAASSGSQITVYSIGGNDLTWDATAGKIYVSMPGVQGEFGDSIAILDPIAGTVTNRGFIGSDPARMSISGDDKYLYTALYGANAIEQLALPNFSVNSKWNIGGVGTFSGPSYALDLQTAPGMDQTTAGVLAAFDQSPSPVSVMIYDGSTPRSTGLQVLQWPYSSLQWAGNDTTLYAVDQQVPQDLLVLGVSVTGAALSQRYGGVVNPYSERIHFDAGTDLVYTDGGQVIQPSNGTVVGTFGASGLAVPDSTSGQVFILGQTAAQAGTSNYTIESFDQTKFTAINSLTINNVVGTPTGFIRWGTNGLAFTTRVGNPWDFIGTGPGQLYVVSGSFVTPAVSSHPSNPTLTPVHRTWNLEDHSSRPTGPVVVSRESQF